MKSISEPVLRGRAKRRGYAVVKSRVDGTYGLRQVGAPGGNWRSRVLILGDPNSGFGFGIEDIAEYLSTV